MSGQASRLHCSGDVPQRHAYLGSYICNTKNVRPSMLRYLSPGDLVSDAAGLAADSENRMVFRMFINTLVWGAIGTIGMIMVLA
ncbi:MAG: hypothetical protein KDJ36_16895 [Hyphomicrobiaceae bacterium]|nr:hypothetical protein [Hyphomicrobiaceae bacterium]